MHKKIYIHELKLPPLSKIHVCSFMHTDSHSISSSLGHQFGERVVEENPLALTLLFFLWILVGRATQNRP